VSDERPERRVPRVTPYPGRERRHHLQRSPSPPGLLNGPAPAVLRAAVTLGVPAVIALWLVYVLTMVYPQRFGRIDDALARIERRLVQTCVVAAASEADRAQCFAP
jgi:hypothetical protein